MNKKKTLEVIEFAAKYAENITKIFHEEIGGKKVWFYANNAQIADFLQNNFTKKSFEKLFALCKKQGVFDLHFYNHIPSVTFNAAAKHMTRKWPRDHMGMMPLIEDKYCDEVWVGIVEWSKAYDRSTEIKAFERVLKNPDCAKHNGGIAHTFWQTATGELKRDQGWKMHQRIESHGELLKYSAKYSKDRLLSGKDLPQEVIKTIVRLTHYLYVQGVSPQSCGAWEEIPFAKGINWDNASVVKAFEEVVLLINVLQNKHKAKECFVDFEEILCKKFGLKNLFESPKKLEQFIAKSLKQIRHFYLDEFHGATKRIDSSSVMLCAEDLDLSDDENVVTDVQKHFRLLRRWENFLVHEFGAWRYNNFFVKVDGKKITSCDSYLNLNYYILCDGAGHLCSSKISYDGKNEKNDNHVDYFMRRGKNAYEKTSAQWGLPLSYAALAYGKLTAKLLDKRDKQGKLSILEQKLLAKCFNKNQEYIKRTYANISGCQIDGKLFLKADGKPIEPFRKPEAYQTVTSKQDSKKFAFVPGVNDHLGWDVAKCYEASKLFLDNLKRIEA